MRFVLPCQCKMYNSKQENDTLGKTAMIVFELGKNKLWFKMTTGFRALVACGFLVLGLPYGEAQADGQVTASFVYELGEARIELAEQVLRTAADYVATNSKVTSLDGHVALKRILNDSRHFRSILAISKNGELLYDSYNAVRYEGAADLSGRSYFRNSTDAEPKTFLIHSPQVGKQSGETFVPMTMAVPNDLERDQAVVALVVPPSIFVPRLDYCAVCGVSVVHSGQVIASSRPMSDINEAILANLSFDGDYGNRIFEVRGMPVNVHWRKAERTGLVYIYYEAAMRGDSSN